MEAHLFRPTVNTGHTSGTAMGVTTMYIILFIHSAFLQSRFTPDQPTDDVSFGHYDAQYQSRLQVLLAKASKCACLCTS